MKQKEFLRQIAESFLDNNQIDLKDLAFVFPNRRSSLYFTKYLGEESDKPIFSPKIYTINSLFIEMSGLRLCDNITSLYQLYLIYIKYTKADTSFDEFVFWGDLILNDFDDIDKYLVDAQRLFSNIKDLNDLNSGYEYLSEEQREAISSFWKNFLPFKNKDKEKSFMDIWSVLYMIYKEFKDYLFSKNEGYEGMIYRDVAEDIIKPDSKCISYLKKYKKVIFVGLNALNNCEKRLLDILQKEELADFYWDYYGSVIKDSDNKSSMFMEDNVRRYPSKYPLKEIDNKEFTKPTVHVIAVPSAVGQAKELNNILEKLLPIENPSIKDEFIHTAVVLPDERMLSPVLNSIPEYIDKINVTMGYPLSNSNVATFMELISQLRSKIKIKTDIKTGPVGFTFYFKTVLDILNHPFIQKIDKKMADDLKNRINKENMVYVQPVVLKGSELLETIFDIKPVLNPDKIEKINILTSYQLKILEILKDNVNSIDKEFCYHYYLSINKLKAMKLPIEEETYFKLLKQLVSGIMIPFRGEPLDGLQIMGPLETRVLDFHNLIILSVNEGVFPKKTVSSSFIPYNLRKGFGLPNYEFQDAVSAYHFYRNIYRAENIYLLYDSRTAGLISGEESRFIKQLEYHHKFNIDRQYISYDISINNQEKIEIPKTSDMIQDILSRTFSASSMNNYIDCPLKYYFSSVKRIREEDEVTEEVEASMFGTLFHACMENIYNNIKKLGTITASHLENLIHNDEEICSIINDAFLSEMSISEVRGRNKIIFELLKKYIKTVLSYDKKKIAPFQYIASEQRILVKIPINAHLEIGKAAQRSEAKLFGFIDRLDKKSDKIRIVDYKTGKVHNRFRSFDDLFDSSLVDRPITTFQMGLYLLMYKLENDIKDISKVNMNIYSLREIFNDDVYTVEWDEELLKEFTEKLISLIEEITNVNLPFIATPSDQACKYCPYSMLCNK